MSQKTTLNLDDYIQDQHKNNTDMVVRLNDGSIIFVDEQALDKNKMSAEGNPVKNFGVRSVSYTHLTLPTICSV